MNSKTGHFSIFFLLSAVCIYLDQLTKHIALEKLGDHVPVPIIPEILEFLRIENDGAAFGILKGKMAFFYVITLIICCLLFYVLYRLPADKKYFPLLILLSLIFSGAIGNLIDRAFRKSVVDFIYFKPIDFPVFNVADIYVTTATFFLVILVMFYYKDEDLNFLSTKKEV